jgi:hypothetical protein
LGTLNARNVFLIPFGSSPGIVATGLFTVATIGIVATGLFTVGIVATGLFTVGIIYTGFFNIFGIIDTDFATYM